MRKYKHIVSLVIFILAFTLIWQMLYILEIWPQILFPSIKDIFSSLYTGIVEKSLGSMVLHSLILLFKGLMIGIVVAILLSTISKTNEIFSYIYNMLVSIFDLIPGIAIIPIAILWIGIGDGAIIFMVFHSVVWPISRSIIDGFRDVPKLYIEVGQNIGLNKFGIVKDVLFPAALPRIFSGIKIGWARAWRGLISAEMVFGGGSALGIGYYISERRTNLDISGIFATIIIIICIGMIMEYGVFRIFENKTFKKWGMS